MPPKKSTTPKNGPFTVTHLPYGQFANKHGNESRIEKLKKDWPPGLMSYEMWCQITCYDATAKKRRCGLPMAHGGGPAT